jgi:hypothetical protein
LRGTAYAASNHSRKMVPLGGEWSDRASPLRARRTESSTHGTRDRWRSAHLPPVRPNKLGPTEGTRTLPLYEIILRFSDRDEVRLTDQQPPVGQELEIGGRMWLVGHAENGRHPDLTARYVFTEARNGNVRPPGGTTPESG